VDGLSDAISHHIKLRSKLDPNEVCNLAKMDSTVRYLGVEIEDALATAEAIDI
jgi:hypothetical protein